MTSIFSFPKMIMLFQKQSFLLEVHEHLNCLLQFSILTSLKFCCLVKGKNHQDHVNGVNDVVTCKSETSIHSFLVCHNLGMEDFMFCGPIQAFFTWT